MLLNSLRNTNSNTS